jgi:NAD/NADP transhydrogenase alpha subunit
MSPEWFAAADAMLLKECKSIDVIITTALIPGRKAPILIKKNMVEAMPHGGVTVDLAAAAGGNVETTGSPMLRLTSLHQCLKSSLSYFLAPSVRSLPFVSLISS